MKKFNDYIKEDLGNDESMYPSDMYSDSPMSGNQDVIFADIQSDIEQMPQDEVNEYLQNIIDYCQSMMV